VQKNRRFYLVYEFEFRTGKISINRGKCTGCTTHACVKACGLYGSGILKIWEGRPQLTIGAEETKRLCTECLACEFDCFFEGEKAISIHLPIPGLDELRRGGRGNTPG
jgi:hypothetical protein